MIVWVAIGLLILAGFVLVLNHDAGSIGGLDNSTIASLAALTALLIVWLPNVVRRYAGAYVTALRDVVVWAAIALVLVAVYAYRNEFKEVAMRITGELAPAGTAIDVSDAESGQSAVRLRRDTTGHFKADAAVNGESVSMIVDTGATTIVLTMRDAERAGIATADLSFMVPVQTANGEAFAAPVRLESVAVGPIVLSGVEALVAKPGALSESLLGMNFLSRLRSYEFSGDFLTLRG